MKTISKRKFKKMLKDNMLVFGPAGTGKATMTTLFFDEQNTASPLILSTLYETTHKRVSHQKIHRRIPYKYGKHAYKKGVK